MAITEQGHWRYSNASNGLCSQKAHGLVGEFFFFNKFYVFIYLFLSVLGLHCCARASHCGGFSCCGAQALGARATVVVARVL